MGTQIGIGFSQNQDALTAAKEAAEQAKTQLDQKRIDIGILFNTVHYNSKEFLPVIHRVLSQAKIIGTSTAGIILSDRIETQGIGILAIHSEEIMFETSYVSHLGLQELQAAGNTLAKEAVTDSEKQHRKLFVFFPDGLLPDSLNLVQGIKEQMGNTFSIIGAASSDNFHFQKTYQYFQKESLTKGVVAMLLGGRFDVGMSCKHGWKPLGKPRTADKTQGHIVQSIDNKKAIDIYREYFPDEAETLKAGSLGQINLRYPLGIHISRNEYLLRNITGTTDDGNIICKDNVPENSEVHIMLGNKSSCLKAAQEAAQEVKKQLRGQPPKLIMIFASFLRHKLLGRAVLKEIKLIKDILAPPKAGLDPAPLIGMYSYGEVFNFMFAKNKIQSQLQNGSIIVLAIT